MEENTNTSPARSVTSPRRPWLLAVIVGALLLVMVALLVMLLRRERPFTFMAFDVGQGDALFAETPSGKQLLIDGGPSGAVLEKLGRAMPFFDRTIDVVVLTHPDADHLTGLVDVFDRYRVGELLLTGVREETATSAAFWALVHNKQVPIIYVVAGDVVRLDEHTTFTVLAPFESWKDREAKPVNNTSIVGRLDYRNFSVLLPGDAESSVEEQLVRNGAPVQADVLKLGHHGSTTSTTDAFLSAVHPSLAIISVGKDNHYGHPSPAVMQRVARFGIPVLRTDTDGDIRLESFGDTFRQKRGIPFRVW